MPDKKPRSYRYQEIAAVVRAAIDAGDFDEAELLPSEAELSATHKASRVTIRKALEHLRDQGLIASRQGHGWFVGGAPIRQSLDTLETIEHQLAAAGRTSRRSVIEFGFGPAPAEIAALLGDEVLAVVRLNLADDRPFALVTVWCTAEAGAALSRSDVERSTFVDLLADRLGEARQVISARVADAETAERLAVEPGSALLRVYRITLDRQGIPAMVSEQLYPAAQTEFEVTLRTPSLHSSGLRLVH